ncbi:MAG TPA: glycosyltransferase family 1 protein [Chloroflexota bacterium]|nr:glycosyltransferase family 1 protein [Chloroflexota bacterium]
MRIGVDCRIAHYTWGGTAVYTRRLVEAMAPQARSDELVLFEAARATRPLAAGAGARRKRLFTPSHHRWEQALLPLELLPHALHVLHSTDYIPPFVRRCRSVITVHDLAFLRWPEHLTPESRAYFNGHIRRATRSADAIIAVSQATKADLVELLGVPAAKISVVYEAAGLELPEDAGESSRWREAAGVPEEYVLFVGTLEPRKNLVRLIEAFADVRRRGYGGWLLLAGSPGWNAEPILEAVRAHADCVRTCELDARLYAGASALAIPSLYEGFGLPLLEAMAGGVPVLTSNVSSLPEIAGDAALLVEPQDVEAIADGLERLVTDADLARSLAAKGKARAAEFSWERAAAETLRVYHSLA